MLITLVLCLTVALCGDNNVQWNGVSHIPWQDCRPLVPVDGEPFSVYLQTYKLDVCDVRVFLDDGAPQWITAAFDHDRGPYAVWKAALPATTAPTRKYWFELTDGSDIDYYSRSGMSDDPPTDGGFVVDAVTLSHAPPGATPVTGGTVFKVWAPTATSAWVRGEFNGWGLGNPLVKHGEHFVAKLSGNHVNKQYKFFFTPGDIWKPDPRARSLVGAAGYNSVVRDPLAYKWIVADFKVPAFEDMIIYELHVGTFAGRNDPQASGAIPATFKDVAAHVDHLVELGVNVVELTPITEFPADFSAGYNPITAWSPELKYGTPDDLKYMVDVLHQHGIAVILDIVWNHLSPTDNFLWQFDGGQIYFDTPAVQTPWGSQPDFDRGPVREYLVHAGMHWLDEFRLDGFRMDGADFMNIFPQEAAGWSLMQWHNDLIDNRWIDKVSIAEQLPDDAWVTRPTALGGAGFDAQWHDAFNDRLREAVFDAAFGNPNMAALAGPLYGSGQYLEQSQVVNYLELHDEAWPSSGGQRIVKTIDTTFPHDDMWARGRVKLAQGVVFTAPGIPAILQGSEWLEDEDFGGGNAAGANRIDWSKKTRYADIFAYFRDLIRIRRLNAALKANSPRDVYHVNDTGNAIAFHRWTAGGNDLVVVANFSNTNYPVYNLGFPQPGVWYELLNSQAAEYGGNGLGNGGKVVPAGPPMHGFAQSASIVLPQMGLLVFRHNQPPCPDANGDGQVDQADLGVVLAAYDACAGQPQYNYKADFNRDGCVNQADLGTLLADFGGPCTY